MSFWDKVKDFVGIEDDYYEEDEYYEDYDNYEEDEKLEENTSDSYFNEVKEEEKPKRSYESTYTPSSNASTSTHTSKRPSPVKRSYGTKSDMQVSIREPLTYEESKSVLDDVLEGKTVVLNLEMLEVDKKTQIFYFVSGGVYSVNGSISNVTKDIYVLVPEGVEISDKLAKTVTDKSLYQI